MQSIEINGLNELINRIDDCIEFGQVNHRALHERISERMKQEVDTQILSAGFQNAGEIAGWQSQYVGSGGGYAAVRAIKDETGDNSPGAITNYLENGHAVRPPGKTKPRAKQLRVQGYHFYDSAKTQLMRIATEEAEAYLQEIADRLKG